MSRREEIMCRIAATMGAANLAGCNTGQVTLEMLNELDAPDATRYAREVYTLAADGTVTLDRAAEKDVPEWVQQFNARLGIVYDGGGA